LYFLETRGVESELYISQNSQDPPLVCGIVHPRWFSAWHSVPRRVVTRRAGAVVESVECQSRFILRPRRARYFFSASFGSPRCSVPVTAVGGVNRVPFGVRVRFLFVDPRSYNSDHSSFSAARLSASKDMSVAIGACSWTRGCVVQHGAKRRAMWRAIGAMIVACLASNNVIILTIDVRLLDEGRASRWAARRMWKLRAPTLWIPTVQSAGRTFSASTFIFRLFQIYIYIRKCMCTLKRYRCEFNMRCFTILTCCRC